MADTKKYNQQKVTTCAGRHAISEVSVVLEKPLTLFLNQQELTTMICSPGAYEELCVGFDK